MAHELKRLIINGDVITPEEGINTFEFIRMIKDAYVVFEHPDDEGILGISMLNKEGSVITFVGDQDDDNWYPDCYLVSENDGQFYSEEMGVDIETDDKWGDVYITIPKK